MIETLKTAYERKSVIFFYDNPKNSMIIEFTDSTYNLIVNKEFLYHNNIKRLDAIEYISTFANDYIKENPTTSTAIGFFNYLKFIDRQKKIESLID